MPNPTNVLQLAGFLVSANGNTLDLPWGALTELIVDLAVTSVSGTNPTITFTLERKDGNGNYVSVWASSTLNSAPSSAAQTIGPGLETAKDFGLTGRLKWVIGGTGGPTVTFSASINGK